MGGRWVCGRKVGNKYIHDMWELKRGLGQRVGMWEER